MTPSDPDTENLTRKQRRDQAREQRKAQEEAQVATAARRRRMMQLGGVVAAVIVVIVVIVIATSGSKNPTTETHTPTNTSAKNAAVSTVEGELNGIPQNGNVLGNPKAPVTMQYFGDLECPYCRLFTLTALPDIIKNEVRTGKLKIEYKSMETATRNPPVFLVQQSAAYAAGDQNKAWYFIELFYNEQGKEDSGYVNEKYLTGLAEQVPGLNLGQWHQDRKSQSQALETEVLTDEKESREVGFEGTPSFMLGKTGQKLKPFSSTSLESSSAFEPTINELAS